MATSERRRNGDIRRYDMSVLSKDVNGALVWYESAAEQRWLDAIGDMLSANLSRT